MTDHPTIPAGHKTARVRGWRVEVLRELARSKKTFTARQLMVRCNGSMTILQAQALCSSYVRKGELKCVRRGVGGLDSVEAIYCKKTTAK